MADGSDVEIALVTLVDAILYPTGKVGAIPLTVLGVASRIERGWPDQVALDADLRLGYVNASIYGRPNTEKSTARYPLDRVQGTIQPTTYTLSAAGQVVTVGGAAPGTYTPQNLAVFVNGKPYVYQALTGQTPAQIATALQALIVVGVAGTTVAGAAITLPATARIGALRVGATGSAIQEVGRTEKQFQIILWCPTAALRDAAGKLIDANVRALNFLTLADGTLARITYHGSNSLDGGQKEILYRRDLIFSVEWAAILVTTAAQMVAGETDSFLADGTVLGVTYS
jgi:hypothetical protein